MFTNKEKSGASFLRRPVAIAALVGLAATMAIGVGVSSATAAGGLTNVNVALSNNQSSATGVTLTEQFTTATTGTIASVTMTNLTGMSQSGLGVGTVYGLGAGVVSVSGGISLVYTLNTPVSVSAGTPIYLEITNFTNYGPGPSTPTFTLNTVNGAGTAIDSGATPSLSMGGTNTAAVLQVAKSLSFTNDTPSYTLLMDPSLAALADITRSLNLGVKTNAGQGYSISIKDTGLKNAGTGAGAYTIPASAASVAPGSFAANTFGTAFPTSISTLNSLATQGAAFSGVYSGLNTTGTTLVTATKPTGNTADVIPLINRVKIDYTTPAGTYTDTITYTATPAY